MNKDMLEIANCPNCDGSGAYHDNYGEVCQCQFCHERDGFLASQNKDCGIKPLGE